MPPMTDNELDFDKADRGDEYSPLKNAGLPEGEDDDGEIEAGDEDPAKKSPSGTETAEDDDDADGADSEEDEGSEEDGESEETNKRSRKRIRIPKERFDEAMTKARAREEALNQKIQELEQARQSSQKKVETSEIQIKLEELQDKYEEHLIDGDRENAKKVRAQLDRLRDQLIDERTTTKTEAARRAAIDELKYDAQLANFEGKFPVINPDSENFDEAKTEEVGVLLEAFVARGFTRHAALAKAVKYVLGEPKPEKSGNDEEETATVREKRAADARKKAASAAKQQAPSTNKVGIDSDKAGAKNSAGVDILRMSQDKFAELDEKTLAELRGDDL